MSTNEDGYFEYMTADEDDDVGIITDQVENEYELLTRVTDTSSEQARRGKDIQGIPWDRLHITRENYRRARLEQYNNYDNVHSSGDQIDEMRNLVWATSKHDVYFTSNTFVMHWSSISCELSEALNFSRLVAPLERHPGNLIEGISRTQISTLAVKDNLLVAGGFQGELTCKHMDRAGVSFCTRTDNAITNSIDIYRNVSGSVRFMSSNNDGGVREIDVERFQLLNHFRFPWPINHTSTSPDGKLFIVVGDDRDGLLVDSRNGKVVTSLVGHLDYSFASAWHPDSRTFSTGNQDKTCRVWDIRNLSSSTTVLRGNLGAVRSIRYSSDGRFMVVAEPADFVHIYDTKAGYKMRQELDFFGEISGVSLSPDDESMFVGVWDRVYASMLHYSKKHAYNYLDSFI
ncbi:uncharacterized protein A4U43_C02F9000 [Asparagus officinalis]|uniref:Uncharacterized protein n=1 Tax=Asparagus officinalis TaxID=4686 RepID=A0A5P1FH57_ASPOF|nr:uncharacterized protein A4U43_C02F9000 [Asparagus officinalis]